MRFSTKKLVNHDIGPNYQSSDAWLALRLMLFPWVTKKKVFRGVYNWFYTYLKASKTSTAWLTDSGRTALYLLLKSLDIPKDSEVLIQGFSCVVVPNAVLQAGYKPVICEAEETSFNIDFADVEKKITSKTKVLIVQHSFGIPVDMQKAKGICDKYNLVLIEDAAHSLNSKVETPDGYRNVGSVGDAAIFSFGRDKVVSTTIGGMAVINTDNKGWKNKFLRQHKKLPEMSHRRARKSLFYVFWTTIFVRPFYYFFNAGKFFLLSSQKLSLIESVYTKQEQKGSDIPAQPSRYNTRLAKILLKQLKQLDKYTDHRHSIAKIYTEKLGIVYHPGSNYMRVPLDLAVMMPGSSSTDIANAYNAIKEELRFKHGCLIGTWYDAVFLPKTVDMSLFGYKRGDLPQCESLANKRVLNLPTNHYVNKKDAIMISTVILKHTRSV